MPLKPFKIIVIPPEPPTFDQLARQHNLSKEEKSVIKRFAFSARHEGVSRKSTGKIRLRPGERVVTRKK